MEPVEEERQSKMRIVNVHISDKDQIPLYTAVSLKKARECNPHIDIDFICKKKQPYFSSLGIKWIDQNSLSSELLTKFNEICWFKDFAAGGTIFPNEELHWHRTTERIYYLEAYLSQERLENVFHCYRKEVHLQNLA